MGLKKGWWLGGFGTSKEVLGTEEWPYYLQVRLDLEARDERHPYKFSVELRQLWAALRRFSIPGLDVEAFSAAACMMQRDRSRPQQRYAMCETVPGIASTTPMFISTYIPTRVQVAYNAGCRCMDPVPDTILIRSSDHR